MLNQQKKQAIDSKNLSEKLQDEVSKANDGRDEALKKADFITKIELVNNRLVPNPLECRSTIGQYNLKSNTYNLYCSSQGVHSLKKKLYGS